MSELERTALHEAGHSVAARAVGHRLGQVTIRGGPALAGCSWSEPRRWPAADLDRLDLTVPFSQWPARIQGGITSRAIVLAAGEVAEVEFMPRARGRVPESIVAAVVDRLERVPALTRAELMTIEHQMAETDTTGMTDGEQLWRLARLAHGDDHLSATTWARYVEAQAGAFLSMRRGDVERLAALLLANGSLSAAAVRQVLR